MNIEQGLDFLLSHFESNFPRTVSTLKTQNRQVEVFSREEALKYFKESELVDCRISAFGREEIEQEKPNLIFVDLDDVSALEEARALFYKTIHGIPTILHTGNGLAILQPINMISLKGSVHNNYKVEDPAKKFLQFAEKYLTNHKCDSGNHPSLKSCLIRVPGSYNSKCLNNGMYDQSQVFPIQEWNGVRCNVQNFPFKSYLNRLERECKKRRKFSGPIREIPYIENILRQRLSEGRKRIFALVLCPYLVNVKKLSLGESEDVLSNYFHGYVPVSMIRYKLREVFKKGILPYGMKNMRENDPELYKIVTTLTEEIGDAKRLMTAVTAEEENFI